MRNAVLLLALLLAAARPAAAQRGPEPAEPRWPAGEDVPVADDWVQLDSAEWLKGELIALYEDELVFDSVKFGPRTLDWKDVRQVWTARAMAVGLVGGESIVGKLVIAGDKVRIVGDEPREVERSQVLSIAPGWTKPFSLFGGKISAGLTLRQGNVDQVDANVSAEIEHRRVRDRIELDYLASYNSTEGTETTNDQRIKGQWHHFVTDRFFVKPVVLEWYRDPTQNLASRTAAGAELGYQFLDTRRTEWQVSGGLAWQQTRWVGVEAGEETDETAAAFIGSTSFEQEWTEDIDFKFDYTFYLTQEAAGRYIHHALVSVETEWTDTLDFDVSLYWDRTEIPQAEPDGTVPDQDDFRMVISLGIEF
ncbi:MAG TPA: DUF481 domain-containing protein [Thermoanaerobaculia bacterium]|nr:DUF481 domain-containing protein [Thermoanaerobaculia bacterium]